MYRTGFEDVNWSEVSTDMNQIPFPFIVITVTKRRVA